MPNLPIIPPTVPEGFCNTLGEDWVQQIINLMGGAVALFDGAGTIILNQETVPDADERVYLWFRPSTGRVYRWDGGAWVSPHPSTAEGIERKMFEGTPAEIWAQEGGDGSDPASVAPATNVGAMWEIDTAYAGRSPMGVGAISGSDPSKNLALSEDYGAGSHAITIPELPEHDHDIAYATADTGSGLPTVSNGTTEALNYPTATTGDGDAMLITHPVRGLYICKRTARVNYVGN
jgi:hypothetical protein